MQRYNQRLIEEMKNKQTQERVRLPKIQRSEAKTRMAMYKKSLRITATAAVTQEQERERIKQVQTQQLWLTMMHFGSKCTLAPSHAFSVFVCVAQFASQEDKRQKNERLHQHQKHENQMRDLQLQCDSNIRELQQLQVRTHTSNQDCVNSTNTNLYVTEQDMVATKGCLINQCRTVNTGFSACLEKLLIQFWPIFEKCMKVFKWMFLSCTCFCLWRKSVLTISSQN